MAHTNSTPNYNLPQFLGTDKPAWLTDVNNAMSDIDTAIAAAKSTADTANAGVTSLGVTVGNHTSQLSSLSGAVTSQGNTLNTVTALIGNGVPTTTDQTIIGAINELNERKYKVVQASGTTGSTGDKLAILKTAYDALSDAEKANAYIVGSLFGKGKFSNQIIETGVFTNVTLSSSEMTQQYITLATCKMFVATTAYATGITTWTEVTSGTDANEFSLVLA